MMSLIRPGAPLSHTLQRGRATQGSRLRFPRVGDARSATASYPFLMLRCRHAAFTFVAAVFALGCGSAAAGSATSASAYQVRLNGICRTFTPTLKKLEADAAAAKRAGNADRISYDLGYGIALGLREDVALEAVSVPAAMQRAMSPILRLFKSVDSHARAFLLDAQANNLSEASVELKRLQTLSAPANRMLDRAGLADCGSGEN